MIAGPDVLKDLATLCNAGTAVGVSEGDLLERFLSRRDETAFATLVARNGPMVLGVCRRLLRDPRDVEDAFQATFLVLVRKARSLRDRERLGNWLYGVAYRVSLRARANRARRRALERPGAEELALEPSRDPERHERLSGLDEEVIRLPERFRSVVVLCYLGGQTHEEAARTLGCPLGTVKSRLSSARERLRGRMTRRGLAPLALPPIADLASTGAWPEMPAALASSTTRAAARLAAAPE